MLSKAEVLERVREDIGRISCYPILNGMRFMLHIESYDKDLIYWLFEHLTDEEKLYVQEFVYYIDGVLGDVEQVTQQVQMLHQIDVGGKQIVGPLEHIKYHSRLRDFSADPKLKEQVKTKTKAVGKR